MQSLILLEIVEHGHSKKLIQIVLNPTEIIVLVQYAVLNKFSWKLDFCKLMFIQSSKAGMTSIFSTILT